MQYSKSPFCRFLYFLIFIILFFLFPANVRALKIKNYTTREYGRQYEANNLCVVQDKNGILYFGNAGGVLTYNASSWDFIPIKQGAWVLSMYTDSSGIVYIGSQSEFGQLLYDESGTPYYKSISNRVKNEVYFSNIWKVWKTSKGIYFQAEELIFLYSNDKLVKIEPETSFHLSFCVNDKIYVRQRQKGLYVIEDSSLIVVDTSSLFKTYGVFGIIPQQNHLLIVTQEKGLWNFNEKDKQLYPFSVENEKKLVNAGIYGTIKLNEDLIALNTLREGLFILDKKGNIVRIYNEKNGLNANNINFVMKDRHDNLWLALNKGIALIDYNSPLQFFSDKSGLTGTVNTLVRFDGKLYAGTSNGLFVEKKYVENEESLSFMPVSEINKQVWFVMNCDNDLMIGTNEELMIKKGNRYSKIIDYHAYTAFYDSTSKTLFVGGQDGLLILKKMGQWKVLDTYEAIADVVGVCAEPLKKRIWIGTRQDGVVCLNYDGFLLKENFKAFSHNGLPESWIMPYLINDTVVFATQDGCFKMQLTGDNASDEQRKPTDILLDIQFEPVSISSNTSDLPVYFINQKYGKTWYIINNEVFYYDKKACINTPFKEIDFGKINFIYPESPNRFWICADDGLILYDALQQKKYDYPFNCFISKVLMGDKVLFNANKLRNADDKYTVNYSNNSMRFDFTALYYKSEEKLLYSVYLEGYDTCWSNWKHENYAYYTNLYEGKYIFKVKARNVYGFESTTDVFVFRISPPWYRTAFALTGYVLLFLFILWFSVMMARRRLKKQNIILEQKVKERTIELQQKNELLELQKHEIDQQKKKIEEQKDEIVSSIRYAEHIQEAIRPMKMFIDEIMPEYFVLLKPRDIVSGDFYWMGRKGNYTLVAAADCTGHGVPGAFLNMLGAALLNETVSQANENDFTAASLLDNLREKLIRNLHQRGKRGETSDGMDIALCMIHDNRTELQFAGAYNPLYLFRKNLHDEENPYSFTEIKADRMPVANHQRANKPFTNNKINLLPGDTFYIFSDGFIDQFGGEQGKKLMASNFKSILLSIQDKNMPEQKDALEKILYNWKGNYDQTDDILVIGIRV